MACQVIRDNKGNIESVLAPNKKESLLFRSINSIEKNKELALHKWSLAYTPTFKSIYGEWEELALLKLSNTPDRERIEELEKQVSIPLDENGEPLIQALYAIQPELDKATALKPSLGKIRDFLRNIGVTVNILGEITVDGVSIDANASADLLRKTINIVNGKAGETLTEEAMHFVVAIVESTNPELYQEMLNKVNKHPLYQGIFDRYKDEPLYQKEGKPNIPKIKKEAIAQILEQTYNRMEGDAPGKSMVVQWFEKVREFLKSLFSRYQNPFEDVVSQIVSGRFKGDASSILDTDIYLQTNANKSLQDEIIEKIEQEQKITLKVITDTENKYTRNGQDVKNRATTLAKRRLKQRERDVPLTKAEEAYREATSTIGTNIHQDMENIIKRYLNDDGSIRVNASGKLDPLPQTVAALSTDSSVVYDILHTYVRDMLTAKYEKDPGVKIFLEMVIYDEKRDLAGTVDFLAVGSDGKVDIMDWKSMGFKSWETDINIKKQQYFKEQLNIYKEVLKNNYGVKEFGQTMAIPIKVQVLKKKTGNKDYELYSLEIGDANYKKEKDYRLLPVMTDDSSTGDVRVDREIRKFRGELKKLMEKKVPQKDREAHLSKILQLNTAIRVLQVRGKFSPLFDYISVLEVDFKKLQNYYDTHFKNKESTQVSEEDLIKFQRTLNDLRDSIVAFLGIGNTFKDFSDDQAYLDQVWKSDAIVNQLSNNIDDLTLKFADKFLGERLGVVGLTAAEREYKGVAAFFRPISRGGTAATTAFFKLLDPVIHQITIDQRERVVELQRVVDEYKEWAAKEGLTNKNMFDILLRKDEEGKRTNHLIAQLDREFYLKFNEAKNKKDKDWFRKHINLDKYAEEAAKRRKEEIASVKEGVYHSDPMTNDNIIQKYIRMIAHKYDINTKSGGGWGNYLMLEFVKEEYFSKEYKKIRSIKPVYSFYKYIIDLNKEASSKGMIGNNLKKSFLPWVRYSSNLERMAQGSSFKIGSRTLEGISQKESEYGYGRRDEVTGELIYDIYPIYVQDFTRKEDKEGNVTVNYDDVSFDLFKNILLYQDEIIRYSSLRKISDSVNTLLATERIKDHIQVNERGKIVRVGGEIQTERGNDNNFEILKKHVMGNYYGIDYGESDLNMNVFTFPESWDNAGKKINSFLGYDLFPTDLGGRTVPLPKLISALNMYFSRKVLSANITIAMSNFFGGKAHSLINAGKFYDRKDLMKAEWDTRSLMLMGDKGKKLNFLIGRLYPFIQDDRRNKILKVTNSKLGNTSLVGDILMAPHRYGTMAVELPHIIAMFNNAVVIDGKVQNVQEYLEKKYKRKTLGTAAELQQDKEAMKKEKEALLRDHSFLDKLTIKEDGSYEIDGKDPSTAGLADYRSAIVALSREMVGAMDAHDKNLANRNIIAKSFMVFKNWIPPLLDKRVGSLREVPSLRSYDEGRWRTLGAFILANPLKACDNFIQIYKGTDKGIALIKEEVKAKQERYLKKYGKELEITEAEYMDIVNRNLASQVYEIVIGLSMILALQVLIALAPDDDERSDEMKNYWNFQERMARKIVQELTFFYNPLDFASIVNSSLIPGISIVTDAAKFLTHLSQEGFGLIMGDEELRSDSYPLKYAMKMSPIFNNLSIYMAIASEDFAESMGIKVARKPYER